ncbi:hypothetical protein [Rubellimicrobium arenae]|uniref:hypothetical protein n=1 Tax=Rubellimicrobium arenae TaxID=2817372 RepID=UPI001B304388|nr:hypothetical protein [Rubellimicrobium arenae]
MIVRFSAFVLPLLLGLPALAEGRSDAFLDLVGRVPSELVAPGSEPRFPQVHFADHAAAAALVATLPPRASPDPVQSYGPYARLQTPLAVQVAPGLEGGWEPRVGFGPLDIRASLVVAAPPHQAMLLRLADGSAEGIAPALLAAGYEPGVRDGVDALVRNPEDFGISLGDRHIADPFGGALGAASRVLLDGSLLLQANNWPDLLAMAQGPGGVSGRSQPDLAALAAVLDRPDWGDAALIQAVLWPEQAALSRGGHGGLPPWRTALMADLATGLETRTLVLFSYADRASAEAAAARLEAGWATEPMAAGRSLREITETEAETQVLGDGPFVAVLSLRAPTEALSGGWPVNGPFVRLLTAQARGDLMLFGPA